MKFRSLLQARALTGLFTTNHITETLLSVFVELHSLLFLHTCFYLPLLLHMLRYLDKVCSCSVSLHLRLLGTVQSAIISCLATQQFSR